MDSQRIEINSSGTSDDLPLPNQNRISLGGRLEGNEGPDDVPSVSYPRVHCEADMDTEIHRLEQEAYCSVLRAFKAQSDAITWEKESLLTELRKELRVGNEEHKELISLVNANDVLRRIRDWRRAGGLQSSHDPVPSPSVSAPHKKQKITQPVPHQSFARPSPHFEAQQGALSNQLSIASREREFMMVAKGETQKSAKMLAHVSSTKFMPYPPSGPTSRNQVANRISYGGFLANNEAVKEAAYQSLIGRKVRTRWPRDSNLYEALVTDYNAVEGCHALVYDGGTANEAWRVVNVAEMSPADVQWEGDDTGIPPRGWSGRSGHGTGRYMGRCNAPAAGRGRGRGRGRPKGQSNKVLSPMQNGIRMRRTDSLIKEVEKVFATNNPDPIETEKAKKLLMEHEQALLNAIRRLGDISDGECDVEFPTKLANQDGLRASAPTVML